MKYFDKDPALVPLNPEKVHESAYYRARQAMDWEGNQCPSGSFAANWLSGMPSVITRIILRRSLRGNMVCKTHHTAPARGVPPEARRSNISGTACPCRIMGNTELVSVTAGKAVTAGVTPRIWLSAVATAKHARLAKLIGAPAMLPLTSSKI